MTPFVRTALGDIPASDLGRTDYHDHLFQVTPLLPGDELDDEHLSGDEAHRLHEAGVASMVDATPVGLGRNPEAAARISQRTDMHVVLTTGAHHGGHYPAGHWIRETSVEDLAVRFRSDLTEGLPMTDGATIAQPALSPAGAPVRAGMLKAGIGYWDIGAFEHRVLEAISDVHATTNAPITVHTEFCSAAFEVLELLSQGGVKPDRVVLAHADRNPDAGLHRELAAVGAYLGYDGMARHRNWPDSSLIELIATLSSTHAEHILLGGDVARRTRYIAYGGMPGLEYLPKRFLPRLEKTVGSRIVETIMVANPQRLLSMS